MSLLVRSITGISILAAGAYNVSDVAGTGFITEGLLTPLASMIQTAS